MYSGACPCRKKDLFRLYINPNGSPVQLLRIHKENLYMANYESVLIARQDLAVSQVNDLVSSLSDVIKNQGGEVVKVDNWGLKNLAYRIKKNRKGHYVLLNIVAPSQAVTEYERLVRLNEDIIRYMTVKVDEFNSELSSDEDIAAVEAAEGLGE